MRPKFQSALLLVLLIAAPWLYGQGLEESSGSSGNVDSASPARLLNLDEGLAIIGAAMETAHHRQPREDCSHFVHEIYGRAGFPYGYENSLALYDGTADFQRVSRPQPGDLVVWRGHMGIIVNPVQHSFFSSLRTGFGVEKYDSRYWRKRGHPRFYRYVKSEPPVGLTLASAKTKSSDDEERPAVSSATTLATLSTPSEAIDPLAGERGLPVVVSADRATPDALRQALEEKFSEANPQLASTNLLTATKPVVIIEKFEVKKVHVKHDQGWAEVRFNAPSSLTHGQADLQRHSEKQRWPLYRSGNQWQLELPGDAIYLPKDTAVRLLAHELAAMTGRRAPGSEKTEQEAQLARLLDRLLGE